MQTVDVDLIEGQVEIFVSTLKEFLKTTFLTFRFPNENSWDFPDLFTQCAQKRWKQWEKTVFGTMVRFGHFQSQICSRCTKALERRDKTVFGTIVRFGLFQSEKALERWDKTVFATMVIVWRFHAESWKSVLLWLHNRNRVTRHRICSKPLQSNYLITWCRQWMLIS